MLWGLVSLLGKYGPHGIKVQQKFFQMKTIILADEETDILIGFCFGRLFISLVSVSSKIKINLLLL